MLTAIALHLSDPQLESLMKAIEMNDAFIETNSSGSLSLQVTNGTISLEKENQSQPLVLLSSLDPSQSWLITLMKPLIWPDNKTYAQLRQQFEQSYDTYVNSYVDLYSLISRRDTLIRLKNKLIDSPRGSVQEHDTLLEIENLLENKDPNKLTETLRLTQKELRGIVAHFVRNA